MRFRCSADTSYRQVRLDLVAAPSKSGSPRRFRAVITDEVRITEVVWGGTGKRGYQGRESFAQISEVGGEIYFDFDPFTGSQPVERTAVPHRSGLDVPSAMPVFVGLAAPSLAFATCVACSWATVASELVCIAERPSSTPRRSEAASFLSAAPWSVSPVVPGLVASAAATLELANYPGALRKRQDMGSVVHQGRRMNGTVLAPERPLSRTSGRPRQCCAQRQCLS